MLESRVDGPAAIAEPEVQVHECPAEDEPTLASTRIWGRRATLWEWLVVLGAIAVFGVIFHRMTQQRVSQFGRDAFPQWLWDTLDLKYWPLKYFRGGAYAPSWWPF